MATYIFSILETVSSVSVPGAYSIRRRSSGRAAYCEISTLTPADHRIVGMTTTTFGDQRVCFSTFSHHTKNISYRFSLFSGSRFQFNFESDLSVFSMPYVRFMWSRYAPLDAESIRTYLDERVCWYEFHPTMVKSSARWVQLVLDGSTY